MDASPERPEQIERREAIRRVALLLGGAVSAPAALGVLAGCGADGGREAGGRDAARGGAWAPRALTAEQLERVSVIAEHVLPETSTPGARAAGVPRFVDTMLAEYYAAGERERFLAGLAEVDGRAFAARGRSFLRCGPGEQLALLEALDREAFPPAAEPPPPAPDKVTQRGASATPPGDLPPDTGRRATAARAHPTALAPAFFRTMKELTLLGYYTSQAGATRELRHAQVPGRFEGCVPLARVGRAWAV